MKSAFFESFLTPAMQHAASLHWLINEKPASNLVWWMLAIVATKADDVGFVGAYFALISFSRRSAWPHLSIM